MSVEKPACSRRNRIGKACSQCKKQKVRCLGEKTCPRSSGASTFDKELYITPESQDFSNFMSTFNLQTGYFGINQPQTHTFIDTGTYPLTNTGEDYLVSTRDQDMMNEFLVNEPTGHGASTNRQNSPETVHVRHESSLFDQPYEVDISRTPQTIEQRLPTSETLNEFATAQPVLVPAHSSNGLDSSPRYAASSPWVSQLDADLQTELRTCNDTLEGIVSQVIRRRYQECQSLREELAKETEARSEAKEILKRQEDVVQQLQSENTQLKERNADLSMDRERLAAVQQEIDRYHRMFRIMVDGKVVGDKLDHFLQTLDETEEI